MLEFPGENTDVLLKDKKSIFREPLPEIGNIVGCKVIKVTPTVAYLVVTHIEGEKCSVGYKAVIRPHDIGVNILENQFVWDKIKQNDTVVARIISYGDSSGMYVCLFQES